MTDDASETNGQKPATAGRLLGELLDEYETFTGRSIDRHDYAELKRAIDTDVVPIADADRSFFVLGSYGEAEETRLRLVADRLDAVGKPFLLQDLDAFDDLLLWTTQFKVMASRATHIVGCYEHSAGGHEWEAGWLDHDPYRRKLTVLKRDYPDLDPRDEPFDGMFAHFLESLAALGRLHRFDAPTNASATAVERALTTCVSDYKAALLDEVPPEPSR